LLLVVSQVILSFLIPLPMIPLIIYTRSKKIMGEFVNRSITNILAFITAAVIIGLNAYLLLTSL
jgi:manganese transport protein